MSQVMALICYIIAVFFTWQSFDDFTVQQALGVFILGAYALLGIPYLLMRQHRPRRKIFSPYQTE